MIIIDKEVKLKIDDKRNMDLLSDVCEAARLYLEKVKNEKYACCGLDQERRQHMQNFIHEILDNI